jgi:hypothetical protein
MEVSPLRRVEDLRARRAEADGRAEHLRVTARVVGFRNGRAKLTDRERAVHHVVEQAAYRREISLDHEDLHVFRHRREIRVQADDLPSWVAQHRIVDQREGELVERDRKLDGARHRARVQDREAEGPVGEQAVAKADVEPEARPVARQLDERALEPQLLVAGDRHVGSLDVGAPKAGLRERALGRDPRLAEHHHHDARTAVGELPAAESLDLFGGIHEVRLAPNIKSLAEAHILHCSLTPYLLRRQNEELGGDACTTS